MSQPIRRIPIATLLTSLIVFAASAHAGNTAADSSIVGELNRQAVSLAPLYHAQLTGQFLAAVTSLPKSTPTTTGYYNRSRREMISEADFAARPDSLRNGFEKKTYDEQFYYYTGYGTPLAFSRAVELVGAAGMNSFDKAAVVDFGFGSIGQLRLMASLGAQVTGIEVSPVLSYVYAHSTGAVPRAETAGKGADGSIELLYGFFPGDSLMTSAFAKRDNTVDVFFSKNTLKNGYIHPEKAVDPKMLVHLGVTDTVFVKRVHSLLKPHGYFMIYNICPKYTPPTDSVYIPWSDGRCPFDRALLETTGFRVIAYNTDDTEFVRKMGESFGWFEKPEDRETFFGTYTLLQKK